MENNESTALSLVTNLLSKAISGNDTLGLSSTQDLALSYINNKDYFNNDETKKGNRS